MDQHIADLLGIDLDDPAVRRESAAIERDMQLIEALVATRKQLGLSQADVASRMGRTQPSVSDFERVGGDPHLSTIRRYALAIGAEVRHTVCVTTTKEPATQAPSSLIVRMKGTGEGTQTTAAQSSTAGVMAVNLIRRSA
ncbi:helix-turn-helix transcriptional regulator [Streptosporangium sp. NPDC000563]|uniref:helix-turn-helix domain-containing protein n=1 Tax=unclassified Streptosporangium TaxID=2632669 RepID=UPI003325ADF3